MTPLPPNFIHLRVRTEYSLIESLIRVNDLAARAAKFNMPAVALADRGNLYGLIKFHNACKHHGIKPLTACEMVVQPRTPDLPAGDLLFLARNQTGYLNLLKLVSKAHTENRNQAICVQEDWLAEYADGLLVLSGGRSGTIGKLLLADKVDLARTYLDRCQMLWDDAFYLEIQRVARSDDEEVLRQSVSLATDKQVPVVATHDVCFLDADDFEAHETRVCINEGTLLDDQNRSRHHSNQQYLKSPQEMAELFADLPNALVNSVEIAKRCNLAIDNDTYHLPHYTHSATTPDADTKDESEKDKSEDELLQEYALKGMENRYQTIRSATTSVTADAQAEAVELTDTDGEVLSWQDYLDRLNFETNVINSMGFAGYFLIVMEFVNWAKENDIPVGPGRGSGAGSLIAYALGITEIDPLEHGLLFERFLNPERKSMPDFDIDFCIEGRDRVIAHVAERYGEQTVSQIITFGTMAAKAVVRDVARAQNKPLGLADKLAKLIPFAPDMTLKRAMEEEAALRDFVDQNDDAAEIMEMAYKLEGVARNAGKHPGGVVIAPKALWEHVPVTVDENGTVLTQFDKDDVEAVGLVKFDFLGLRTLTIIDQTVKTVNARHFNDTADEKLNIETISLTDPDTFKLLQDADTKGVFQLESRGMRDLIKKLAPTQFEDLAALVALYRPGPLQSGMVGDFTDRKHGRSKVSYLHPELEPILKSTYGVILYQEQVMQIARTLGGYSLGDADILRRAMGKKQPKEMARQRSKFLDGTAEKDIPRAVAEKIFSLMEEFAGYGFNKSHSYGYALVAYQTAWLKRHYLAEFMAVTLSSEMQNTDRLVDFVAACKAANLQLSLPNLNQSGYRFTVLDETAILYGLGAIKGVGEGVVEEIVQERANGDAPYNDLFDFCMRQNTRRVNKRTIEALIKSGAMDALPETPKDDTAKPHRAALMANVESAVKAADQQSRNRDAGLTDLFGEPVSSNVSLAADQIPPWSAADALKAEYEALGLYLSIHPMDLYQEELATYKVFRDIAELRPNAGRGAESVAGLIVSIRRSRTRSGDRMAFLTLEDSSGRMDVIVSAELLETHREWLTANQVVVVAGSLDPDEHTGGVRMRAKSIQSMAMMRHANGIWLSLYDRHYNEDKSREQMLERLRTVLRAHQDSQGRPCLVRIQYRSEVAQVEMTFDRSWAVVPSDKCLSELRDIFGADNVSLGRPESRQLQAEV